MKKIIAPKKGDVVRVSKSASVDKAWQGARAEVLDVFEHPARQLKVELLRLGTKGAVDKGILAAWWRWQMTFDHLPQFKKSFSLASRTALNVGKAILLAEIAKCEVVCMNCHADRTQSRLSS